MKHRTMTIKHRIGNGLTRNKWKCDICGKVDFWGDSWTAYGSVVMEENCPWDMPSACSDRCLEELQEKIDRGAFVPPIISVRGYHFKIVKERRGY